MPSTKCQADGVLDRGSGQSGLRPFAGRSAGMPDAARALCLQKSGAQILQFEQTVPMKSGHNAMRAREKQKARRAAGLHHSRLVCAERFAKARQARFFHQRAQCPCLA